MREDGRVEQPKTAPLYWGHRRDGHRFELDALELGDWVAKWLTLENYTNPRWRATALAAAQAHAAKRARP